MKKLLTILMAIVFAISVTACGASGNNTATTDNSSSVSTVEESAVQPTATPVAENTNKLGDYEVEILSARNISDYEGNSAIAVNFKFTNNSEDTKSFIVAVRAQAFQDGVELSSAITMEENSVENQMKEIKSGATIEVECLYKLDSQSDVEIEVSELFAFSDKSVVAKTFSLSEL